MNSKKMHQIIESLYLIYLMGAVFLYSYNATMIDHQWLFDYRIFTLYGLAGALFVAVKTILEIRTWHWKEVLSGGFVACSLGLYFLHVHFVDGVMNTFQILVLIIGAHHVDFKKILKAYIVVKVVVLTAAYVLSMFGYAVYYVVDDWTTLFGRHAFGTIFPTDFAANLVYLSTAVMWLRAEKLNHVDVTANLFLAFFVYRYCKARNSAVCFGVLALTALVVYVVRHWKKNLQDHPAVRLIHWMTAGAMPIGAALMIAMSYFYREDIGILAKMNKALSNRLQLGNRGFAQYDITLFGQEVYMNGFGGGQTTNDYFFLDSSYVYVLLLGGVLVLLSCLLIHTLLAYRAFSEKKYVYIYLLLVISLHCAVEQHIMEVAYNPFMLSLLAHAVFASNQQSKEDETVV